MHGIILAFIATFFGSSKDILSKKISLLIDGTLSAFLSFVMALPWYLIIFVVAECLGFDLYEYQGRFLLFIFLRAIVDSLAELCKMHAMSHGEISFVSNFFSLTPIFILFMAPWITGESVSLIGILGVIIIFFGTAILFTGPNLKIPWTGVTWGLFSSFFFAINTCLDRLAATHGNPIFCGFLMTSLSALVLFPAAKRGPNLKFKIVAASNLLLLRGLFEVLFMTFKLSALQFLEAQYVAGIGKFTLVLSVIIGGSLFHEEQRLRRVLSSLLIMIGSIVIVLAKVFN